MGIRNPGWVVIASLAAAVPLADAEAQRLSPREAQRGVTVLNRPRPDFDPLGVRLGGFRLDGSVEAGLGWDSNLFGRSNNIVSDGYASETASLALNSDWTRHAVGASGYVDSRQYFSESALDWTDWNLGGFGRYDLSVDTNVEARYRHYREHLDVYNFDVQTAGLSRPVPYDSDEFSASGSTRFNRIGVLATGTYRTYRFEDVSIGGVRTPVSVNNFDTAIGALGVSYSLAPGRSVLGIVRVQDISYTDSLSRGRDSFTWEALAGFEYDFDGVWQGRVAIGWRQRNYSGAQFRNLEGLAAEGQLTWAPTQITTVTFNIARTIEESIRRDAVSYIRTAASARVDHEYLRNLILGAELRADRREYERPDQTATDGLVTLSARYMLNRSMSVVGTYTYTTRLEATGGINEYDRNLVQLRLRIAL